MMAGLLRDKIEVQQPTVVRSNSGANSVIWKKVIETRAKVRYKSGNRAYQNSELVFAYTVDFTVRHYHNINEQMRIVYQGKKYRILAIEKDIVKQWMVINAEVINE